MSKYTPGPWVSVDNGMAVKGFQGEEICELVGEFLLNENHENDGPLIAKAPDMKYLLELALQAINSQPRFTFSCADTQIETSYHLCSAIERTLKEIHNEEEVIGAETCHWGEAHRKKQCACYKTGGD